MPGLIGTLEKIPTDTDLREATICKLYGVKASRDEIAAYFQAQGSSLRALVVEKDYVAAPSPGRPGNPGYVVRNHGGGRLLDVRRWGFPRPDSKAVVNVRNHASPF